MTVLILHDIGGHAGIHWQQWLHDELQNAGYKVLMPQMPDAAHPDRKTWLKTVRTLTAGLHPQELLIVAHSLGVATALDFIERLREPVRALLTVSGFISAYGADINDYFMKEKTIDMARVTQHLNRATVFYGDNDPYVPQSALKQLAVGLKVKPVVVRGGGHLNADAGYTAFPALLDAIIHPQ